jgi:hypothetical protein
LHLPIELVALPGLGKDHAGKERSDQRGQPDLFGQRRQAQAQHERHHEG